MLSVSAIDSLCYLRYPQWKLQSNLCNILTLTVKQTKTTSMLSPIGTGLHIIYSIPLLFLKIPHTNEIFYVLSVSTNYSLCVLSALSTMENPIKLVEYSDSHSKIDKTTSMKVLSSPFYLLFNTNLFLCFLRCLTRVSRSVSSNCCFILNQLMQNN